MSRTLCRIFPALFAGMFASPAWSAVNSYRFLHVTIETPWHLFLFLLMGVFAPFILMVVLMWRHSLRKRERPDVQNSSKPPQP